MSGLKASSKGFGLRGVFENAARSVGLGDGAGVGSAANGNDKAVAPVSVSPARSPKKKRPAPISIRLSDEERARLEQAAAGLSLSAYIRVRLFADDGGGGRGAGRVRRRVRAPVKDEKALAQVLSLLGRSDMFAVLTHIVAALDKGDVALSPATERDLREACVALVSMRKELIKALGLGS